MLLIITILGNRLLSRTIFYRIFLSLQKVLLDNSRLDSKIPTFLGHFSVLWGKLEQTVKIRMIMKIRIYDQCIWNLKKTSQKVTTSKQSGPWKKSYTLEQCYSKCGLPPGAGPQTVRYNSAVKSRN